MHGFYAGMGGFTFPLSNLTSDLATPIYKSDCKRLTLTARGVALLADCDLLPNIGKKFINDKSKSDGLSKFIACIQASWLVIQVIGRLILDFQVTLLEINTLGHCLCALIMYILWWHKPRMVGEPIVLEGEWLGPLCAYMYMCSRMSGQRKNAAGDFQDAGGVPEIATMGFYPGKPCKHSVHSVKSCRNTATIRTSIAGTGKESLSDVAQVAALDPDLASNANQSSAPEEIIGGSLGLRPLSNPLDEATHDDVGRQDYPDDDQDLGAGRLLRWCLAAEAVRTYPAIRRRFAPIKYTDALGKQTTYLQETRPEELVEEHCRNWSTIGLVPGDYGLLMGMALWFASMAFAAIHLAAWHDYFPSVVESWLWRCSAIYIIWSGLVWSCINLVAQVAKPFDEYWEQKRLHRPPFVNSVPLAVLGFVCGTLYTFARMFLVLEAFISIRKLPVSAYQTPNWTQIIPHL